jgi:hypothetical protein
MKNACNITENSIIRKLIPVMRGIIIMIAIRGMNILPIAGNCL